VDRQKQGNRARANRTGDGIDRCRTREQETHSGRTNRDAGGRSGTRRSSSSVARAISVSATKRDTEADFSERSELGSAGSTRRGGQSSASSTCDSAGCICFARRTAEIFRCRSGRVGFSTMKMSILPNE